MRLPAVPAVVLLGVASSAFAALAQRRAEDRGLERAAADRAAFVAEQLADALADREKALERMSRRWATDGAPYMQRWRIDAQMNMAHQPGYLAIAIADANGVFREVEPREHTINVIGFPAALEPMRAAAMAEARRTERPALSRPLDLLAGGRGLALVAPAITDGQVLGWIVAGFRVEPLLAAAVAAEADHVLVFHGDELLHRGEAADGAPCADAGVPGWDPAWRVRACASEALVRELRGWSPWLTLAAGLAYTGLGAGLVHALLVTRRWAEESGRLAAEVQAKARALEGVHRELAELSYTVSHELRTPLRAIDGHAALLLEQAPHEAQASLGRIRANAQRMARQIDGLVELLRIARADARPRDLNVSALAEAIAAHLRAAHPDHDVELRVTPGLHLVADEDLVRIILEALLDNAWKFTRDRHPAVVEVLPHPGGFAVRDNGAGFDMAYADKLFRTFETLHGPGEFPGLGLGLAVAARAAASHGGTIEAESRVGEGARFAVRLGGGPSRQA